MKIKVCWHRSRRHKCSCWACWQYSAVVGGFCLQSLPSSFPCWLISRTPRTRPRNPPHRGPCHSSCSSSRSCSLIKISFPSFGPSVGQVCLGLRPSSVVSVGWGLLTCCSSTVKINVPFLCDCSCFRGSFLRC